MLSENKLKNAVGDNSKVLMLTNGDSELTPRIRFVYTFPKYRGNRYMGKLFLEIEKIAKAAQVHDIFISTNHTELYKNLGSNI